MLMAARNSQSLASCSSAMLRALRYSLSAASQCPCRSSNSPLCRFTSAAKADMGLGVEAPLQLCSDARLANAGLAGDQHNLAIAGLGPRPAAQQQFKLFF